jgi:zinc protease
VMNYILGGGGFVSRILDQIRDNMGLAYSAYSYFDPRKYSGDYTVGMQTKNATAKTAIDETLKIIENMKAKPVSDKELQDAKDFIFGSFARKMDTNSKIAGLLSQVEFYNLGLNYFEVYYNAINKVTKDDVLKAAQKYLHPDKMDIVVVGNLKEAGIKP